MARYRNPWHQSLVGCDPAVYETDARPVEHAGHLLYQRIPGRRGCWDVVKDGVCVAQRGGLSGAKTAAEQNAARIAARAGRACSNCVDWRDTRRGVGDAGECWSGDRLDGDMSKGPAGYTAPGEFCEAHAFARAALSPEAE